MRHQRSPWVGSLVAVALLVLAGPASGQTSAPSKSSPWSFEVTPYLWAAGLHGDFSARGRSASVDPSFSEMLKNLDFGLTLFSELRYDRWGLLLDGQYLKLSSDADTPGPAFSKVDVTSQTGILAPSLAYRPLWTKHVTLDVLAGIRAWWVDTELEFEPGQLPGVTVDQSKSGVDPIIGLRFGWQFADSRFLRALGDVGGFGAGSDLTWQAFAGGRLPVPPALVRDGRVSRARRRLRQEWLRARRDHARPRRGRRLPVLISPPGRRAFAAARAAPTLTIAATAPMNRTCPPTRPRSCCGATTASRPSRCSGPTIRTA